MLAYLLFLATQAALVMRPSELLPGASGVHFYIPLIGLCLILAVPQLILLLQLGSVIRNPVVACGLLLIAAVFLSHLSNGELKLSVSDTLEVVKAIAYLFLLIALINTPARLRTFLLVTLLAASAMIAASIVSFERFKVTWGGAKDLMQVYRDDRFLPLAEKKMRHVVEFENIEDDNLRESYFRMRGYGIFADPNDVSLLIMVSLVLSLYFLRDRRFGAARYLWLLNVAMLLYAQWCTQSRGGLVSAAIAGLVFLLMTYGKQVAGAISLLAVLGVPLAAGRLASFSFQGGTGQERIQLWSDGLVQLTTSKILFGTGMNTYEDISGLGLKAHNSWIHAFVELGLFGGIVFFGMAFFPALAFYRLRKDKIRPTDPILRELYGIVPGILAGTCFALCALSRCYTPATYMIFGIAATYLAMVGARLHPPRPIVRLSQWTILLCVVCGLLVLLLAFVFVKALVRF